MYGVRKGIKLVFLICFFVFGFFYRMPFFPATFVENIFLFCLISLVPLLKLNLPYVDEAISELSILPTDLSVYSYVATTQI